MEPPRLLAFLAITFACLALLGGPPGDWIALRGAVPGTGGMLAKGHLLIVVPLAILAYFLARMPREGGPPMAGPGPDEADDDGGPPGEPEG